MTTVEKTFTMPFETRLIHRVVSYEGSIFNFLLSTIGNRFYHVRASWDQAWYMSSRAVTLWCIDVLLYKLEWPVGLTRAGYKLRTGFGNSRIENVQRIPIPTHDKSIPHSEQCDLLVCFFVLPSSVLALVWVSHIPRRRKWINQQNLHKKNPNNPDKGHNKGSVSTTPDPRGFLLEDLPL